MWEFIVEEKIYVTWLCEFLSASVALFYLWSVKPVQPALRFFIYYLVFVFFADLLGAYSFWAYFDDYTTFPFLRDSVFKRAEWLYNIISVFTFTAIINLVVSQLSGKRRKRFRILLSVFIVSWVAALINSDNFFFSQNKYVFLSGTFLLVFTTGIYFYEMINSNAILNFYGRTVFYVVVAALFWHLCVAPLWIYNNYVVQEENRFFFEIYHLILRSSNILMYSLFALGFLIEYNQYKKAKHVDMD